MSIFFFKEEIKFRLLHREKLMQWIMKVIRKEGFRLDNVNYIFCSDKYLRKINKDYLRHDYNTDIVTFDNSTEKKLIDGDIFISIDRVSINAKSFNVSFNDELHRVMVHGILHLLGYDDTSKKKKAGMKKMEDFWLSKRTFA